MRAGQTGVGQTGGTVVVVVAAETAEVMMVVQKVVTRGLG